ncbi:MAG: iron-sulfur cluster carrier protein ApbC [Candidatus Protistobacter heckmanni]|nr:iron-sulfur cluster carrier protein ApbC [Candidatus Protistobacter heckmanni]
MTATPEQITEQVQQALKQLIDPNTGKDLVSSRSARNVKVAGGEVSLDVELGYPARSQIELMRKLVVDALSGIPGVTKVSANVTMQIVPHAVQRGVKRLPGVKNIVAVASGKGGVGKSTTAVNLALALAAEGVRVGILDADIYGPSLPTMLGVAGPPKALDQQTMLPLEGHGLQANSIGFLVEPDNPMAWRGPMVTQALEQLLRQTRWDDLDYLIVDMPPGTGDIQLTLSQRVPVTGAAIVTTPQDIALLDARKGLKMFEKTGIPVLGVVENMSLYVCPNCGHQEHIFGAGERMCLDFGVDFLGSLPLNMSIRLQADAGNPTVAAEPEGEITAIYKAIARKVAVQIAAKSKDMADLFPTIVVKDS